MRIQPYASSAAGSPRPVPNFYGETPGYDTRGAIWPNTGKVPATLAAEHLINYPGSVSGAMECARLGYRGIPTFTGAPLITRSGGRIQASPLPRRYVRS